MKKVIPRTCRTCAKRNKCRGGQGKIIIWRNCLEWLPGKEAVDAQKA